MKIVQEKGRDLPVLMLPDSKCSGADTKSNSSRDARVYQNRRSLEKLPQSVQSIWQDQESSRTGSRGKKGPHPNERRLLALLEAMPHGVQECDLDGKITYSNPAHADIHGYSGDEMLGKHIWDFQPSESKKRELKDYLRHLVQEQPELRPYFTRDITKDGHGIDVRVDWEYLADADGHLYGFSAIITDITESKQASDRLKLFSHALEHSVDGVNITDLEGNIVYCNPASARMYGYEAAELVGKQVDVLVGDSRSPAEVVIPAIKKTGGWSGEILQVRKDGSTFPASVTTSLIKGEDGEPLGMLGVIRDIALEKRREKTRKLHTEQQAAVERDHMEAKLRDSNRKNTAILQALPDMMFRLSRSGKHLDFYAPRQEDLFLVPEAFLDKTVDEVLPGHVANVYIQHIERVLKTKTPQTFQYHLNFPNGEDKHFEARMVISGEDEVLAVVRDITEREIADQKLRYHAGLLENISDAIFSTDNRLRIVSWNRGAETIYGWTAAEVLGKRAEEILRSKLPENQTEQDISIELFKKGSWRGELEQTCKDGRQVQVAASTSLVADAKDTLLGTVSVHRDITEQKRILRNLRFAQFAMEHASDCVYWMTSDARFFYVNDAACQTLGYSREELLKLTVHDIDPNYSGEVWPKFWKKLEKENTFMIETTVTTKIGDIVPVEIRVNHLEFEGQEFNCSIVRDISERRRAEETLRQSEEKYRHLVETAHDLIWAIDSQGYFSYLNQAAEEIYGCNPEDMIGQPFTHFVPNDQIAIARQRFETATCKGASIKDYENQVLNSNGQIVYLGSNAVVQRDREGNIVGVAGTSKDITARKQAQEKLRSSELRYRSLFENALNAILIADDTGRYVEANPAACQLLGCTYDELIGLDVSQVTPPEDRHNTPLAWQEFLKQGKMSGEYRLLRKDGKQIDVAFHAVAEVQPGRHLSILSDISEQKRAEADLRRWARLFEHAHWGIVITEDSSSIHMLNPAYAKLHGLSVEKLLGSSFGDLCAPEARRNLPKRFATARVKDHITFECEHLRQDGSRFPVLVDITAVRGSGGLRSFHVVHVHDISERKQAERALRDSEQRFRSIFESAAIGITLIEPDGKFIQTNKAFQKMLAYSAKELQKLTVADITHPDDARPSQRAPQGLRRGRSKHRTLEKRYYRKNGEIIWASASITALRNESGELQNFFAMINDITERKQAEQALQQSEERFRRIFEEGPLGMAIVGSDYRLLTVNQTLCRMTGYTEEELSRLTFVDITHPDDIDKDVQLARKLFKGKLPYYQMDKRYIKKNQEIVWIQLTASVIRTEKGKIKYGLAMIKDITERKQAEEALVSSRNELQRLAAHLQLVREEERKRIAREIHDELGQTLSTLNIDLELLANQTSDIPATVKTRLAKMSDHVKGTIERVQEIARELRPSLLDNLGLVAALDWQIKEFRRHTGLQCRLTIEKPKTLQVAKNGLATALYRITQEALTNVMRHARATQVHVTLRHRNNQISLIVKDNGVGATKSKLDDTESLGVIGMRERVAALNGTFEIQGQENKGTAVKVTLPLPPNRQPALTRAIRRKTGAGAKPDKAESGR